MTTADTPLLVNTFRMYRAWKTRVGVYVGVFVVAVATALVLDLRLGIQPTTVVFYVLALTAVLMIAVPVGTVAVQRFLKPQKQETVGHLASKLAITWIGDHASALKEPIPAYVTAFGEQKTTEELQTQVEEIKKWLDEAVHNERKGGLLFIPHELVSPYNPDEIFRRIMPSLGAGICSAPLAYGSRRDVLNRIERLQKRVSEVHLDRDGDIISKVVLFTLSDLNSKLVISILDSAELRDREKAMYEKALEDVTTTILDELARAAMFLGGDLPEPTDGSIGPEHHFGKRMGLAENDPEKLWKR